jgi:SNF2 family DNA or RNA helicase
MSSTQTPVFTPKDFQLAELDFLEDEKVNANWDEMGCFKTTTALWLMERKLKDIENPKVLVVTTKSGKGTYFKHAPLIFPDWTLFNAGRKKMKLMFDGIELDYDWPQTFDQPMMFICHYDVFTKRKTPKKKDASLLDEVIRDTVKKANPLLEQIQKVKWDFVLLDEAHRIKNRNTGWTKELKKIKAEHKHVMTGTGFINRPDEIWQLLNFLDKHRFTSYWRFRETYCEEEIDFHTGFRRVVGIKPEAKEEFRALVRSIGPRRTKHEVFKNLPEPIYTQIQVELNPIQRRMYDSIRDELFALDQKGAPIHSPNVLAALQRLRQVAVATPEVVSDYYDEQAERRVQEIRLVEPSSKLDALMEIIEGLEWDEDRRDQIVVFSNFKAPIALAIERFKEKRDINGRLLRSAIPYIHMEQKDNDRKRYEKWAIEFPKKEHQVFICTLQLGSESISLTSATTCVFLDRSWSPKDNEQAISRVWRPGQEEVANIIHINAKETVDQRILAANTRKMNWFNAIFGDEDG